MSDSAYEEIMAKVTALKSVRKDASTTWPGKEAFFVNKEEFLQFADAHHVWLKLNKQAREKLNSALKAESRASVDKKYPDWIQMQFNDSLDVEFIFIYVRYVWKLLYAEHG